MLVLKLALIQRQPCCQCSFFVFKQDIAVFVVLLNTEVTSNNLRAFRPLRVLSRRYRTEPNFLNFAVDFEELFDLFESRVERNVANEESALLSFLDLESTQSFLGLVLINFLRWRVQDLLNHYLFYFKS